ncbi:UDP-N-acetylglucosamine--N-acetylmuramyl-(pentapeptide) pyrophosphoryl-undecaprenol N-acetylglucosamine transferase [Nakamurella sp. UYEF19]|uniref:UDP-N-acetylglucosamine--N-acetylmuramyl- (pentapeptide) pyrophosphoryl-undecaprenol N-acetylglucosamine transferase n=1 Tax=Nakamurella sp. UYEF19 TaxID=1756392 RepID=UPI00339A6489
MSGVRVLIAGGGSAGHVQPALAVADALVRADPSIRIICLGTAGGLETILVPEAGYELRLIPEVKFRRKINLEALRIPARLVRTVRAAAAVIRAERIDVVIGFGGYVSLPAYLAARVSLRHRIPVVVHEANARAGIANKVGARVAAIVAAAVPGSGLKDAVVVGNPVRRSLSGLDLKALRVEARAYFGLDPDAPTLLVIGGSLGAIKLNDAFSGIAAELGRAGVGVLHAHGRAKPVVLPRAEPGVPPYVPTPYLNRMDLAYAAADLIVARSGAITVAEIGALKVPVVYVPLVFGNGEQRLNAVPQVESGAALTIDEDELTGRAILDRIVPLVKDPDRLAKMSAAANTSSTLDADDVIARLVLGAAGRRDPGAPRSGDMTSGEAR